MLRSEAVTPEPAAPLDRDKGVRALPRELGIEDVEGLVDARAHRARRSTKRSSGAG